MNILSLVQRLMMKIIGVTFFVYFVLYSTPGRTALTGVEEIWSFGNMVSHYKDWSFNVIKGDLGEFKGLSIADRLKSHIPRTILLVMGSLALSLIIALFMCLIYFRWTHSFLINYLITSINLISGLHIIVLSYVFVLFDWVRPNHGFSIWLLIILALGNGTLIDYFTVLRTQISDVMNLDYVSAALARGANPFKHASIYELILAVMEATSSRIPTLVGGTIIVEYVFSYLGIGYDIIKAVENRHFELTMGITLVMAFFLIGLTDITHFFRQRLDPKISN
jgi:peptide/nickel transport system permease protein